MYHFPNFLSVHLVIIAFAGCFTFKFACVP